MFHFPGVIDTQLIGQLHLIQRFIKQPLFVTVLPRPRQLVFVKDPEFHVFPLANIQCHHPAFSCERGQMTLCTGLH